MIISIWVRQMPWKNHHFCYEVFQIRNTAKFKSWSIQNRSIRQSKRWISKSSNLEKLSKAQICDTMCTMVRYRLELFSSTRHCMLYYSISSEPLSWSWWPLILRPRPSCVGRDQDWRKACLQNSPKSRLALMIALAPLPWSIDARSRVSTAYQFKYLVVQ